MRVCKDSLIFFYFTPFLHPKLQEKDVSWDTSFNFIDLYIVCPQLHEILRTDTLIAKYATDCFSDECGT